ncbi:MAG: bifunctional hydroxymethylpyrimidine kinase/phosphomethylpyrimidine kinase [Candidatus Bathyarchaeia archaeon]
MKNSEVHRALTIAGSDSSGGAGIQADLKTFAALGVHGMSALTAVTAQNTLGIRAVYEVPAEVVRAQIKAVIEDIGVDVVKTGMLNTVDVMEVVAEELEAVQCPIVVDPVMAAKSGARLIKPDAEKALVERVLPLATVVTPNAYEAEALSGARVRTLEEAKEAAIKIARLGPQAVVVKGGHIPSEEGAVDTLYMNGEFQLFRGERVEAKTTHGTGCSFASAIAAELAKGKPLREAVRLAKELVAKAVRFGLQVGGGYGPVNPAAWLHDRAERYETWRDVLEAVRLLESEPRVALLVPEVQMNLVMATPYATSASDVVGIPGRIVKLRNRVKASSCPEFGASHHVASTVITAMSRDRSIRAGMNIRCSPDILEACEKLGFTRAAYDRRKEPEELKRVEGATIPWGTRTAIEMTGFVPDVVYHLGDWGKEAMATLLGRSGVDVAGKAIRVAKALTES